MPLCVVCIKKSSGNLKMPCRMHLFYTYDRDLGGEGLLKVSIHWVLVLKPESVSPATWINHHYTLQAKARNLFLTFQPLVLGTTCNRLHEFEHGMKAQVYPFPSSPTDSLPKVPDFILP